MGITRQKWGKPGDPTNSGKLELGTSPNVLMPNVVRIEQLSSAAKERFLTGKMAVINKVGAEIFNKTSKVMGAIAKNGGQASTANKNVSFYESFYGFLHKDNVIDIGISPKWGGDNTKTDKAFSNFTNILKMIPKIKVPFLPIKADIGGLIIDTLDSVKSFVDTSNDLIGLSNTSTGGVTIRDFTGVDLSNFSVKCAWYVPEQEALAIDGITTIMRMAYPKPLSTTSKGYSLSDAIYKATKGLLGMYKPLQIPINATLDAVPLYLGKPVEPIVGLAFDLMPDPNYEAPIDKNSVMSKTVDLIYKISEVGGQVTTVNPFPVRLTIGHILDIEPLIITSVKVIMSQETFINDKGLHLPIFIEVDISMKYWLNPTPENDFMSIAGTEMYGYNVTQPKDESPK